MGRIYLPGDRAGSFSRLTNSVYEDVMETGPSLKSKGKERIAPGDCSIVPERDLETFFFRTAKKLVDDLLSEFTAFYERILLVPRLLPDCFSFKDTTQCAVFPCDDATTTCEDGPYPVCVCKANFAKTQWDTYSCSGKCDVTLSIHENLTWSSSVSVFLNSQRH